MKLEELERLTALAERLYNLETDAKVGRADVNTGYGGGMVNAPSSAGEAAGSILGLIKRSVLEGSIEVSKPENQS